MKATSLEFHLQRVMNEDNIIGVQGRARRIQWHADAGLVQPLGQTQCAVPDEFLN